MAIWLTNGTRSDTVKDLQSKLNSAGYDLAVDGYYGGQTEKAVRDYQTKNNLTVDGIVGDKTWGSLTGGQAQTAPPVQTVPPPDYTKYSYDPNGNEAYRQAMSALDRAQQNAPSYQNSYDVQLNDIYNQIVNRDKFSYDINGDMLYRQYRDYYTNMGQMAMKDTMGQAAALTGGYGSSYGQAVGQQQYDAYLKQLGNVIPELYGMALNQYNAQGEALQNQYAMTANMANNEYARYMDEYNRWQNERNYAQNQVNMEYDRGYNDWYGSQNIGYSRQQDAYNKLVSLMTTTGYAPTAQELSDAGMSESQAQAYRDYYAKQNTPKASYSGGGRSGIGAVPPGKPPEEPPEEKIDIEKDLNAYIRNGASKSVVSNYLKNAYKAGIITQAEYEKYREIYVPLKIPY